MSLADWSIYHRIKALQALQQRRSAMDRHEPTLAPEQPPEDAHEEEVIAAVKGVEARKKRIAKLEAELEMARREAALLRAENEALKAVLEQERTERAYYHRFAIEVATSLNLVGQVCDEVMSKAQQEAYRRQSDGQGRSELPALTIPKFLRAGPRAHPDPQNGEGG